MTSSLAYAETTVLSCALKDRVFLSDVLGRLRASMFSDPRRGGLFDFLVTRARTGDPFTTASLLVWLDTRELAQEKKTAIARLVVDVDGVQTDRATAEMCVEAIRRAYHRSGMERSLRVVLDHLERDQVEDARGVLARYLDETSDDGLYRVFASPGDDRDGPVRRYEEAASGKMPLGTPYGFAGLDLLTYGYRPGELTVWAGYAGELKTTSAVKISLESVMLGKDVLYCSLEMPYEAIEMKLHAAYAFRQYGVPVETQSIRRGSLTPSEAEVYRKTVAEFDPGRRCHIWSAGGVTLEEIEHRIAALSTSKPVDLVVIDYLQLVPQTGERWIPEHAHLAALFRDCKRMAMRRGVHVLVLHQINRDGRTEAETRGYYVMADLSGSSEVEKTADVVFWSLLTDAMRNAKSATIGCMKNRYGAVSRGYQIYANPGAEILMDVSEKLDAGMVRELVAASRAT